MATITELFEEYVSIVNDDYSKCEDFDRADTIKTEIQAIGGDDLIRHLNRHTEAQHFGRVYTGISYGRPYFDYYYTKPHTYLVTKAGKMHGQSQRSLKVRLQKRLQRRLAS